LLESLRSRRVNHKFHYDSIKQTQKWLKLHEAYSPSRNDPDCSATYERSFAAATERIRSPRVHLIGLGCGGGQKDARLLKLLQESGKEIFYTPSDVSTAMVLVAQAEATKVFREAKCFPLVCDLASAGDWEGIFEHVETAGAARLITFFGMIPNFEPNVVLPRLSGFLRPGDWLLFSANLAPGNDYAAGVKQVLPLYDNELTREWLLTFLLDSGVERTGGEMRFAIEEEPPGSGLKRIAAYFDFRRRCRISVDAENFEFQPGESFRLFFSYRHTPALVRQMLEAHEMQVLEQWVTKSEEEGVFLLGTGAPTSRSA
jgi:uncharacterized SAM-dependent methyltransferase